MVSTAFNFLWAVLRSSCENLVDTQSESAARTEVLQQKLALTLASVLLPRGSNCSERLVPHVLLNSRYTAHIAAMYM